MSTALASLSTLKAKIAATKAAAFKKATDSGAPADPTDAGTVAIPTQSDAEDPSKIGTPPGSKDNKNPAEDTNRQTIGLYKTNPGPTGTDVPSVADGTAADLAATATMGKSAALLNSIAATRAKLGFPASKSASAPAPTAAPAFTAHHDPSQVTVEEAVKSASDIFRQVGEIMCETEEGRAQAQMFIAKKAGQNRALELLQQSKQAAAVYERAGAIYNEEQQKRASDEYALVNAFNSLTPAKQAMTRKLASICQTESFASPDEYAWFIKGAAMMEDALAAQGGGAPPPGGAPADPSGAGGDPSGGAAPDLSSMGMDGGNGELSPEAMMQVIEQLVSQGILPEEEAQKIVEQLLGGAGGGDPSGGDPSGAGGDPSGGGGPPPHPDDAAAAKEASALIASLGAVPDIEAVAASFAAAQ
jgi:hypothetical protein